LSIIPFDTSIAVSRNFRRAPTMSGLWTSRVLRVGTDDLEGGEACRFVKPYEASAVSGSAHFRDASFGVRHRMDGPVQDGRLSGDSVLDNA
jgi:hypothetical protein